MLKPSLSPSRSLVAPALALIALLVAGVLAPNLASGDRRAEPNPTVCTVAAGTTVLPKRCTDAGDVVVSGASDTDISVPVPAAGEWIMSEALADNGTATSVRATTAKDGTVTVVVAPPSSGDAGDRTNAPSECADTMYTFLDFDGELDHAKWYGTLNWRFKINTSPNGLDQDDVIKFLKQSATNIATGRNNCGIADQITAAAAYAGTTNAALNVGAGGCTQADDQLEVVGFTDLGSNNLLGRTCVRGAVHDGYDQITTADIGLDNTGRSWYLPGTSCTGDWNVEGVATHEFGHAFGLGDLSESAHGNLTMSGANNGTCQGSEMTLGRGDVLGLQVLY